MLQYASTETVSDEFCLPADRAILAKIIDVIDGDTVRAAIISEISPNKTQNLVHITIRINGIDTAEVRQKGPAPLQVLEKHVGLLSRTAVAVILGATLSPPSTDSTTPITTGDEAIDALIKDTCLPSIHISRKELCSALGACSTLVTLVPRQNCLSRNNCTTFDAFGRVVADIFPSSSPQAPSISDMLILSGIARPFVSPRVPWTQEQLFKAGKAAKAMLLASSGETATT